MSNEEEDETGDVSHGGTINHPGWRKITIWGAHVKVQGQNPWTVGFLKNLNNFKELK